MRPYGDERWTGRIVRRLGRQSTVRPYTSNPRNPLFELPVRRRNPLQLGLVNDCFSSSSQKPQNGRFLGDRKTDAFVEAVPADCRDGGKLTPPLASLIRAPKATYFILSCPVGRISLAYEPKLAMVTLTLWAACRLWPDR